MDRIRDVVIVGAGPAGSVAAAALAGGGHDVLLIDRARFPRHKVCGEFLSPEARGTLDALGLATDVAKCRPVEIPRAAVFSRAGRSAGLELPEPAWGLSRWALDAALQRAAARAGAQVETGVEIAAVDAEACGKPGDPASVARVRTPEGPAATVRARVILVAAGANALDARRPRAHRTPPRRPLGIKCHLEGVEMPARIELYFFDGGYAGVGPVEGGHVNVCVRVHADFFARSGRSFPGLLDALGRSGSALRSRLAGARPVAGTEKVTAAPIPRRSRPWGSGPRLGDAAASIAPLCGDGMAMAMRSAELAAPLVDALLREKLSLAECRRKYGRVWHAEFDGRLRAGRVLAGLLAAPGAGDLLVAAGALLPGLGRSLVRATRGPVGAPQSRAGYPTA